MDVYTDRQFMHVLRDQHWVHVPKFSTYKLYRSFEKQISLGLEHWNIGNIYFYL